MTTSQAPSFDAGGASTVGFGRLSAAGWVGVLSLALIICTDVLSGRGLVYDEIYYVGKTSNLLDDYGLTRQFLLEYPYPAGLSFAVVQWVLRPLTGLEPRLIRLVNPLLFLALLGLVRSLAARLEDPRPGERALTMMGIPFLWVLIGLALTEMIGMLCAVGAVWTLAFAAMAPERRKGSRLAWAATAGFLLGLAFYSRPPVLVIAVAAPALLLTRPRPWGVLVTFWIGTAATVMPVLILWGGLVPPKVDLYTSAGFSPRNLVLSLAYAGIAMLILSPGWYRLPYWTITALFVGGALMNWLTGLVQIPALATVAQRVLPDSLHTSYAVSVGAVFTGIGLVFAATTLRQVWSKRREALPLFFVLCLVLLVFSVGKITHQFSSRYIGLASPFFVLAAGAPPRASFAQAARIAAGAGIGALSLASYLLMN